jgi:hypothetical protein
VVSLTDTYSEWNPRLPFPRSECPGHIFTIKLDQGVLQWGEYKLPVALKDVHVVDLETFKAGLDRVENVLTALRVRIYEAAGSHLERLTLRERPWRLIYPFSSGSIMKPSDIVLPTA